MSKLVKIIIAAVIALLLIVGIGGAITYYLVKNTPKNTYLMSEQETAKQLQDYGKDRFKNEFEFQDKLKDSSYLLNMNFSADVPEELLKSSDIPKSTVDSSKINLKVGHDPDKNKSVLALNPTIADNEIGKFQWAANSKNQYYEAPIFDDSYKAKNSELVDVYKKITGDSTSSSSYSSSSKYSSTSSSQNNVTNDSLNLNTILSSAQISNDDLKDIGDHYSKFIVDKLDKDNFKKDNAKVTVDGKKEDVKKVTMKLSRGETKKLTVAVLKEAKKDSDIKKIAKDKFNNKSYKKSINKALKDAKKADSDEYPKITSTIWEKDNQILKRNLLLKGQYGSDVKITGTSRISDKKLFVDYKLKQRQDTFSIKGSSKKHGDNYTDKYTLGSKNSYKSDGIVISNKEKHNGDNRTDKGSIKKKSKYDTASVKYNNVLNSDPKNNTQKQKLDITTDVEDEPVTFTLDGNVKLKKPIKFSTSEAKDLNTMSDADYKKAQKAISKNTGDLLKKLQKDVKK